jgi:hypothetical protein
MKTPVRRGAYMSDIFLFSLEVVEAYYTDKAAPKKIIPLPVKKSASVQGLNLCVISAVI